MNQGATDQSTILIVDDTPATLDELTTLVEQVGFKPLAAQGGEEALERIEHVRPDLILLDILMPGMDGFEVCRRLKERNNTKNIPVIFITALSDSVDKIKGFELGAADYITKPFQNEEVLARVRAHLTIRYLQTQLEEANKVLEQRVLERTAELEETTTALQAEIVERKRAEEAIHFNESRLEALLKLSQMADVSLQQIADFVLEEAVKLTRSKIGFIGFMDEDQKVMNIHAWSKDAMEQCAIVDKPFHFPLEKAGLWGEAIRQRRVMITNDYSAPNPHKKGYPGGHVSLSRLMSIPVFEGNRIVAIITVGNKEEDYDESDVRQITLLTNGMWKCVQRKQAEESLRESEERFRTLVENQGEGIGIVDPEEQFTFANPAAERIFGAPRGSLVGRNLSEFLGPEQFARIRQQTEKRKKGEASTYETELVRPDGEKRHLLVTVTPQFDNAHRYIGAFGIFRDITERKRIEDALRESQWLLYEAQRLAHIGHWVWDLDTQTLFWSDEVYCVFGLSPDAFTPSAEAFEAMIHPEDLQDFLRQREEMLRERQDVCIDHRIIRPNEDVRYVQERARLEIDEQGHVCRVLGTVQDITERKRAEEALKASYEQLRNLPAHLQAVREEERTSIAREIHDELGQALVALKMDLSWLKRRFTDDQPGLLEKANTMEKLIDSIIQVVKKIVTELRPGLLDDLGLSAAIEWQTEEFQQRTGIQCDMVIDPEDIIPKDDVSTAVFRIFQETLTNVARHAHATQVHVLLRETEDHLLLEVSDNGKGITTQQISDPKSFGLIGIRERVEFLGGQVTFQGIPNTGTTVTVSIPLNNS